MTTMRQLFISRKFVLALVYLLVQFVIAAVPQLPLLPRAAELSALSAVIVGVAIFGITVEDAVRVWAENRPSNSAAALRTVIEEILSRWLDAAEDAPEKEDENDGDAGTPEHPHR